MASQWQDAVAALKTAPTAIEADVRRSLAERLVARLASEPPDKHGLALLDLLAVDPDWRVRKIIAEAIVHVTDQGLPRVAATLTEDDNAYVRRAAERSLSRRAKTVQRTQRQQRQMEQLATSYEKTRDLYGRLAADKSRRMALELYDVLVSSIVHDMQGLLTSGISNVVGALADLRRDKIDRERLGETLEQTRTRLVFISRFLDDMRAYSQQQPADRHRERLLPMVKEAVRLAREAVQLRVGDALKNVRVNIDVLEAIILEVSRRQIVVALLNVLKNALDATLSSRPAAGGQVDVSAAVAGRNVEIVIRDNGRGMRPEDLAEVRQFVPGHTSKKGYGTGFGLPIAWRNVQAHGGSISIDSEFGRGTTVTIRLPREEGE